MQREQRSEQLIIGHPTMFSVEQTKYGVKLEDPNFLKAVICPNTRAFGQTSVWD
jgi:hypothetical protein